MDRRGTVARGLPRGELLLRRLALKPLFEEGVIGGTSHCFLDLHVLLRSYEDVPHFGDIVFQQMLVE